MFRIISHSGDLSCSFIIISIRGIDLGQGNAHVAAGARGIHAPIWYILIALFVVPRMQLVPNSNCHGGPAIRHHKKQLLLPRRHPTIRMFFKPTIRRTSGICRFKSTQSSSSDGCCCSRDSVVGCLGSESLWSRLSLSIHHREVGVFESYDFCTLFCGKTSRGLKKSGFLH